MIIGVMSGWGERQVFRLRERVAQVYWWAHHQVAVLAPNSRAAEAERVFDADVQRLMAHPDLGGVGPREMTAESTAELAKVLARGSAEPTRR